MKKTILLLMLLTVNISYAKPHYWGRAYTEKPYTYQAIPKCDGKSVKNGICADYKKINPNDCKEVNEYMQQIGFKVEGFCQKAVK